MVRLFDFLSLGSIASFRLEEEKWSTSEGPSDPSSSGSSTATSAKMDKHPPSKAKKVKRTRSAKTNELHPLVIVPPDDTSPRRKRSKKSHKATPRSGTHSSSSRPTIKMRILDEPLEASSGDDELLLDSRGWKWNLSDVE